MDEQVQVTPPPANRVWLSRILLGAFLVLAALSVVAVWSRNQVLDTDRFVRTVSPLADNPNVQLAISDQIATEFSDHVDTLLEERDDEILDGMLAIPIEAAIHQAIESVSLRLVSSNAFADLWDLAARKAHAELVFLLTGGDTDVVVSEDGRVSIDLEAVVTEIWGRLAENRPQLGLADQPPEELTNLQFVIFQSDELESAQRYVRWLERFAVAFPILMVLALIGYFITSNDRWRAAVHSSFGFSISMIVLLVAIAFGRWVYLDRLDPDVDQATAEAVFDILTKYLRYAARILAFGGFVVAGLILLGRPRPISDTGTVAWRQQCIARNRWLSAAILLTAIGIVFIIWDSMPVSWTLVFAIVAIVGIVIIALIPAQPEEIHEATATSGNETSAGNTG